MIMLSAGEPQKYGSIKESTFKPTRGAEKGEKFYTFRDTSQTESVYEGLKHHLPDMETGKSYNVGTPYHVKHGESSFLNPGVIGMGKYQISKGEDEMGKYMAIYDRWGGKIIEADTNILWDGNNCPSGVYSLVVLVNNKRYVKNIILIR